MRGPSLWKDLSLRSARVARRFPCPILLPPIQIRSMRFVDAPFDAALSERYLVYALSTITARSLPDLRDGLKTGAPPLVVDDAPAQA